MLGASARYSCLRVPVETGTPPRRRGKLHIPRFAASGKARSFRCSSSPNRTRFAGLWFGRRLCRPNLSILGKLHIPRFAASGKARSFRCSSSPNRTRLRWAPVWLAALPPEPGDLRQAPYPSLRRRRQSSIIPLLLLSKPDPPRWGPVWRAALPPCGRRDRRSPLPILGRGTRRRSAYTFSGAG